MLNIFTQIIEAIISWIFDTLLGGIMMIAACITMYFGDKLDVIFGFSMDTLYSVVPFLFTKKFQMGLIGTAYAVIFILCVIEIILAMFSTIDGEERNPLNQIARSFVALIYSTISYWFVNAFLKLMNIFADVFDYKVSAKLDSDWYDRFAAEVHKMTTHCTSAFSGGFWTAAGGVIDSLADIITEVVSFFLCLFLIILIAINAFKFFCAIIERYLTLMTILLLAPLSGILLSTKSLYISFKNYWRMVATSGFLLLLDLVFFYGLIQSMWNFNVSGFGTQSVGYSAGYLTTMGSSDKDAAESVVWFFCLLAYTQLAMKFDRWLQSLGLSTAQNCNELARSIGRAATTAGIAMRTAFNHGSVRAASGNDMKTQQIINKGTYASTGTTIDSKGRITAYEGKACSTETLHQLSQNGANATGQEIQNGIDGAFRSNFNYDEHMIEGSASMRNGNISFATEEGGIRREHNISTHYSEGATEIKDAAGNTYYDNIKETASGNSPLEANEIQELIATKSSASGEAVSEGIENFIGSSVKDGEEFIKGSGTINKDGSISYDTYTETGIIKRHTFSNNKSYESNSFSQTSASDSSKWYEVSQDTVANHENINIKNVSDSNITKNENGTYTIRGRGSTTATLTPVKQGEDTSRSRVVDYNGKQYHYTETQHTGIGSSMANKKELENHKVEFETQNSKARVRRFHTKRNDKSNED